VQKVTPSGNGSPSVYAHVRRFCGEAAETDAASDEQSLTAMVWGGVFRTC